MKPLHKEDGGKRGKEGDHDTGSGSPNFPPSNHLPSGNFERTVPSPHDLFHASPSSGGSPAHLPAQESGDAEPYWPVPPLKSMKSSPRVNRLPPASRSIFDDNKTHMEGIHSHHTQISDSARLQGAMNMTIPIQTRANQKTAPSYFGDRNIDQRNLVDDDPAIRTNHYVPDHSDRYRNSGAVSHVGASVPTVPSPPHASPIRRSPQWTQFPRNYNTATDTRIAPPSREQGGLGLYPPMPSRKVIPDEIPMTTAMAAAVGDGQAMSLVKKHVEALERSVNEIDVEAIRDLVSLCQVDQEELQLLLSNVLEEYVAIDNLEEHFALNDRLCSAIENGKTALGKLKPPLERKRSTEDGPTIELLVDNEDVFSLICMLRASNEKKVLAAFALMNFARRNETLRNEIRSSGGMHSFLSLFRSKGSNDVLRIVASMAVAYILPSFVVSSQTSTLIGLKIMDCLRCLTVSNPIHSEWSGDGISRVDMLEAASMGVNILWVNAVHPLLLSEAMKAQLKATDPAVRPTMSLRLGRSKGRTDQGHETQEVWELADSAITLIAHLSKVSNLSPRHPLDVGYDIVDQVCELDWARPIAVREGLLSTLVEWTRSKDIDKVRPAISALRYLVSINDRYMAGWIHSQVVNEGCVGEIVKRLNESIGHDTRIAVAQMLSALCVAPHTRAAVVEARCVGYLVALLYEHGTPESEGMVQFAATALLQLADGAMVRASALSSNGLAVEAALNRHDNVITEILEGWAHGSFIQMALCHTGKLRSVSVEALRVLSEDTDQTRQTRFQLCNAGAGTALGKTVKDNGREIQLLRNSYVFEPALRDARGRLAFSVKDVYDALRGLANMLESPQEVLRSQHRRDSGGASLNARKMLIKGCIDLVKSGALEYILQIATLPYSSARLSDDPTEAPVDSIDLIEETCRLLANLSPLLLSEDAGQERCAGWSSAVYEALNNVLVRDVHEFDPDTVHLLDLNYDVLKGLGALARFEPLKILIVDKSLPKLLYLNDLGGDQEDLANAAGQVLLSLGFDEDEISVQKAGSDPKLLVDWFCLQRSLLLQAMARAELKSMMAGMWQLPLGDIGAEQTLNLIRQTSGRSNESSSDGASDISEDNPVLQGLFDNITRDCETHSARNAILQQYRNVYNVGGGSSNVSLDLSSHTSMRQDKGSLLKSYTFPLNNVITEKEWILAHSHAMESTVKGSQFCLAGVMPKRIQRLLDTCFPSTILRNNVIPFNDLRIQSSFDFRAFTMPQRRYFSFVREGRLLVRLCEKQAAVTDTDEIHWSLCFTNSTFAGEFVESLVQTLYLCPMLSGLSFSRNPDWATMHEAIGESETDDSGIFSNLVGSLPPWVSYLTFDGVLQDKDLRSLVAVLSRMGYFGDSGSEGNALSPGGSISNVLSTGNFSFIGIRYSPHVMQETWLSFFGMIGKTGPAKRGLQSMPLSSLSILDLCGNELGDDLAAKILELVHGKDSGCNLEQLDLSGNRIGRGTNVVRVLTSYTEYYRYDRQVGAAPRRSGWKSTLHTLVLADNDLFLGQAAIEICRLLKRDGLCLRFLDLSNNGLEGDAYQCLASSIVQNTSLTHLDLSHNKFSSSLVDSMLERINTPNTESNISFLDLENNNPSITVRQREEIGRFLRRSRKNAIVRGLKRKETGTGKVLNASDMQNGLEKDDRPRIAEDDDVFSEWFAPHGRRSRLSQSFGPLLDTHERDNMITVLFSAPLVFADESNRLHPFAKLDFDMERELLWQCMKEASRDIELTFDSAHHSRLLASVAKRCTCLHYSGHGHPHFLPFEDGMGGPNWFDVANIKKLLVSGDEVPFTFVFVSACHSGLAGETFASAGVPHVVCCQQEKELKDTAALAFTRSFYLALAVGHTVSESFEQGRKAVRATPNLKDPEKEMEKFVLLPQGGNHDVPVFRAKPVPEWPTGKQEGEMASEKGKSGRRSTLTRGRSIVALGAKSSEIGTRNMMQEDPAPCVPQFFVGREVDMYLVLTALLKMKKRLVTVLGEPGIGRSSLVCGLCHYINERASTITAIEHIFFIKPKYGGRNVSCRSLLMQLLDKLKEAGKCRSCEDDSEVEVMLEVICKSLRHDKALIVFDRTELLEKSDDAEELPMILSTLLYDTKHVKIVLTGRHPLGQPAIGGQVEHPYELKALNVANSIRLFGYLCPHLHTPTERELLSLELNNQCGDCAHLFPGDNRMSERARKILSFVGGGIPAKIEKAAYSISKDAIIELRQGNV